MEWEETSPEVVEVLGAKVARLGYLGGFFAGLGHAPRAVAAFERFTSATRSQLSEPVAETIALTIAGLASNDYERVQHERLARSKGYDDAWIGAVHAGPTAIVDPLQRAAAELASAMWHRDAAVARAAVTALVNLEGPATAAASLLLCGRFLAHSDISAVLDLRDPTSEEDNDG